MSVFGGGIRSPDYKALTVPEVSFSARATHSSVHTRKQRAIPLSMGLSVLHPEELALMIPTDDSGGSQSPEDHGVYLKGE